MPIQRCEIEGQQGWKWGEQGKCYLDSEEGGSDEAKKKAIDQAIAAGATSSEFAELASIIDVPILRAGIHYAHKAKNGEPGAVEIDENELDRIIKGSSAFAPIVKESLNTGQYRGTKVPKYTTMPSFINLVHNDDTLLPSAVKELTKDVDVEYGKKYFEDPETGELIPWMTQTFRNVPQEIAKSIEIRFPKRSVELIPFQDPVTGENYDMVVRSTAFLNNEWRETRPAVSGQDDNLNIEFSQGESPIMVLFSGTPYNNTQQQEEDTMSDTKKTSVPENGVVTELQAKINEQAAELQAYKELHEAEKEERKALDQKIVEMQAREAERDVIEFMKDLRGKNITGSDGIVYAPSKSFCDIVEPIVSKTSISSIIELTEGNKPARSVLMSAFHDIVELAGKDGGMLVALGNVAPGTNEPPKHEQKEKTVVELMREHIEAGMSASDAWKKANEQNYKGGK